MGDELQFTYSTIHGIVGIAAPEEGDVVLIDDPDSGTWACITRDPEPHRRYLDEGAALGTMLLRGLVGGGPEGSFAQRLEAETATVAAERPFHGKDGSYLVLRLTGSIPDWEARAEREVEDVVIRLNGAPRMGSKTEPSSRSLPWQSPWPSRLAGRYSSDPTPRVNRPGIVGDPNP